MSPECLAREMGNARGAGSKGTLGERVGMWEPKAKALQGKPWVSYSVTDGS